VDNNNKQPANMPQTTQPQDPPTTEPVAPQPTTAPSGDSNKLIIFLLAGIVFIAILVGGIYFFLSNQKTQPAQTPISQKPTTLPQENLEQELSNIVLDPQPDADLSTVDGDLNQL